MAEPKQERAIRTRAVLIRAAAEVFDELGFSGSSLNKILQRSGTTMGALYFHFESKEALARAVMAAQATDLALPPGVDGLARLIDITRDLARQLQHNVLFRAGVRLAVEQGAFGLRDGTAYELWIAEFEQQLAAARRRGELLPEVHGPEFARLLVGAFSGTQLLSQIATGRADLPERITALWRYLLPGIAVAELVPQLRSTLDAGATAARATAGVGVNR
ncbi:ScbR family autoregulator-binding transcription factor [Kitasatospora sp. GAS204B]|uniref:ScbR family autoregulator-binding transcription factor n=1 Tax=unclassified Kitasatospora TaxID=2633591 RepID=UPI0024759366|nr:ScbR family autoregulator-binding transcription factor [Kitasatospora sp. GAS204B]MDH6117485.1 AcrR family transcriptional regulator [Kitasatospora sp. GAS204B]